MQQHSSASSASVYNALYEVAEANKVLRSRGGEDTVGRYLSIVARANLQEHVGMRLLHKHNDISTDEIMLETAEFDQEGFALVTAATRMDGTKNIVCNSWQATRDGYVPVEYSASVVMAPAFDASEHADTFEELASALMKDGMSDLLGPCLNYSSYVSAFAPSIDAAFLEKTDFANRANVVRYVKRDDVAFQNSAKTKWYAKMTIDASGKVSWTTACNCFCSVFPEGGHQGTTTHQFREIET